MLDGERRVLELMATGAALPDVLDAICRWIDEQSGLRSSIFLVDATGDRLLLAAAPHLPDAFRARVASIPTAETSCGAAVTRRQPIIVSDIATEPLFIGYQQEAKAAGLCAAWSTPFFSTTQKPLGTFAVYNDAVGLPREEHLGLVNRATYLASIAVERQQTQDGLRESEQRFSTVFYSGPACMTITRFADGRFINVNDRFVTMFGYSRAEAIGQTSLTLGLWSDRETDARLARLLSAEGWARDIEAKARTRSGDIIDVQVWLERIQLLGEDCTLAITFDVTDRKRAEATVAESERLLSVVLDTLPVGVVVVDAGGDIILSNPASRRIWGGLLSEGVQRYANSKGWWHDTGRPLTPNDWGSARALAAGVTALNEVIDIEAFDGLRKTIQNSAVPLRDPNMRITGAVIVNEDISARVDAESQLRASLKQMQTLTGRLLNAQDDERRRIAQMLHEHTAQDLAALKMHLARLTRTAADLSSDEHASLAETIELADRSMTGIRTLSYLLHPPFLDESGLLSAIRWYATGFTRRSGINVELDLPPSLERLPQDTETTLFRVVQEALLNIHRHAASPSAVIRLRADQHHLTLEVQDQGRGMPPRVAASTPVGADAAGVGVPGMRERLQQLGGTLEIESGGRGTLVRARVPIAVSE